MEGGLGMPLSPPAQPPRAIHRESWSWRSTTHGKEDARKPPLSCPTLSRVLHDSVVSPQGTFPLALFFACFFPQSLHDKSNSKNQGHFH
jgi:hypothetical protein